MNNDHSVDFDDNYTVSKEQAVMLILGFKGSFYHDVEGVVYDYSLREYLQDKKDRAEIEYHKALSHLRVFKEKPEGDVREDGQDLKALKDAVDEKKALLDKAHEIVASAEEYVCLIADEVAKVKNGDKSTIRLDPDETKKWGCDQITKQSFFDWRDQVLQIDLAQENGPTGAEVRETISASTAQKNNEITTFLLAQALAELVDKAREKKIINQDSDENAYPKKLVKKDGTLNISGIVSYLLSNTKPVSGQKRRSLQSTLGDAKKRTSPEDINTSSPDELEATLGDAEHQWIDLDESD